MTSMTATQAAGPRRPGSASYDVVVVGGRVAGAATAMLLARCGHKVLMVDRENAGSDTVSTHTVLRLGVLQLKRWGLLEAVVESGSPPIHKVTLGFGSEIVPIDLSDDFGVDSLYSPRRHVLDPILVGAAVGAGVEVMTRARVTEVITERGRASGVTVTAGGETTRVTARFVVGADGVRSRVAARVGARAHHESAPTGAVYYAYYQEVDTDGVYFQFTPGVTAGLIPTNNDEVCVYAGWPSTESGGFRSDPEAAFSERLRLAHPRLSAAVRGGRRVSDFRGTPGLPGFLRQPWGPGWALVGDAAYTKDPISAHGISDALRDAELCARALDEALADPSSEAEPLTRYQQVRDRLSMSLLAQTTELAGYGWDQSRASTLMRGISESVKEECDLMASLPMWSAVDGGMVAVGT